MVETEVVVLAGEDQTALKTEIEGTVVFAAVVKKNSVRKLFELPQL